MKEKSKPLLDPSPDLLKNVADEIDKSTNKELKIAKPLLVSSWPFKMISFLGALLIASLATRIDYTSIHDTAIVGTGLLLVAFAGFLFPTVLNFIKNKRKV